MILICTIDMSNYHKQKLILLWNIKCNIKVALHTESLHFQIILAGIKSPDPCHGW